MKVALTATLAAPPTAPLLVRGPIEAALRLAAELGYDGVEMHLREPADIDRASVGELARSLGLGVPTLGTGTAVAEGLTFSHPDPEVRQRAVARIVAHIGLAAELGSGVTIGLVRGRLGHGGLARRAAEQAVLDSLEACCRAAAPAGVTLFLEPLNRYECDYLHTLDEAAAVIERLGAPNLKLLADTFHMNIEEVDMAASLRRAGAHLGHVHMVDSNRWVPGRGHLDLAGILRALADAGYEGYLSLEALPLPDGETAAREGVRALRLLLEGL